MGNLDEHNLTIRKVFKLFLEKLIVSYLKDEEDPDVDIQFFIDSNEIVLSKFIRVYKYIDWNYFDSINKFKEFLALFPDVNYPTNKNFITYSYNKFLVFLDSVYFTSIKNKISKTTRTYFNTPLDALNYKGNNDNSISKTNTYYSNIYI